MDMVRPLPIADNVWMEELTILEVRDLVKQGSTTALILNGTMEENGPYLTVGKHNHVLKVAGDAIARRLGNTLVAPIVRFDTGNPDESDIGSINLTAETLNSVLKDMAKSLKAQGFEEILFIGDSGSNRAPLARAASELAEEWRDQDVLVAHVPEYYNYTGPTGVVAYQKEVLGLDEADPRFDTYHDDYYISTMIMNDDPRHVRYAERAKVGLDHINTIPIVLDEALAHGKKLIEFRAGVTVAAIEKLRAARVAAR
jgi:hypothetical protein